MLPIPWPYHRAVIVGTLAGVAFFLLLATFVEISYDHQLPLLSAALIIGAVVACSATLVRNARVRRSYGRPQRRVRMTRSGE